jgi:hypothetical protein
VLPVSTAHPGDVNDKIIAFLPDHLQDFTRLVLRRGGARSDPGQPAGQRAVSDCRAQLIEVHGLLEVGVELLCMRMVLVETRQGNHRIDFRAECCRIVRTSSTPLTSGMAISVTTASRLGVASILGQCSGCRPRGQHISVAGVEECREELKSIVVVVNDENREASETGQVQRAVSGRGG